MGVILTNKAPPIIYSRRQFQILTVSPPPKKKKQNKQWLQMTGALFIAYDALRMNI